MSEFIATFHTHLAAIMADRQLKALGLRSTMLPVPRALSSSCGTAVRYAADSAHIDALGEDTERAYRILPDGKKETYELLYENE